MSNRGDAELLSDIKEAIERVEAYIGQDGYKEFLADKKTQDAVARNLQIIGEEQIKAAGSGQMISE